MKKKVSLLLFAMVFSSAISIAQNQNTEISVDFKIRNIGINVDGRFNTATITTNFKNKDYQDWVLEGSIPVNTIDTDNKARDKHLLEADYFDAIKYPLITVKSKSFTKVSPQNYEVLVDLKIKDVVKSMVIPVEIIGDTNSFKLRSDFEINRRDFNVGGGSLILSSTVKISVKYNLNN